MIKFRLLTVTGIAQDTDIVIARFKAVYFRIWRIEILWWYSPRRAREFRIGWVKAE